MPRKKVSAAENTVCLAFYVWTKHGRCLRRWWHDFFRQRRSTRSLRPKSPAECPQCDRDCSLLPHCHKLEVLPWAEHKSCRGHLKTVDTSGPACLSPYATTLPSPTRRYTLLSSIAVAASNISATSSLELVADADPASVVIAPRSWRPIWFASAGRHRIYCSCRCGKEYSSTPFRLL